MRKFFLLIVLCLSLSVWSSAPVRLTDIEFQPETLRYKVMFKWGLINKQAGTATLSVTRDSSCYHSSLTAYSAPWADRIFKVRDTLIGRMDVDGLVPLYYEKIANEGSERKHDVVNYDYSTPSMVKAQCIRRVFKNGRLNIDERRSMEAEGRALDMLTSFYYMRSLPFESWHPGQTDRIEIFSGKQKEILTITYEGMVNMTFGGNSIPTYHIKFTFTSKGGTKTSDDMDTWISADASRIPIRLEGKLPVGKVHCILESRSR